VETLAQLVPPDNLERQERKDIMDNLEKMAKPVPRDTQARVARMANPVNVDTLE
jgi:hypothetical protein